MMNAIARKLEAKKMRATIFSLEGVPSDTSRVNHDVPQSAEYSEYGDLFKGGSVKRAEDVGKLMAKHASDRELTEMEKEALGLGMLGKAVGGVGKMVSGVGKGLRKGFTSTSRLTNAMKMSDEGAAFARAVKPGLRQRTGGLFTRAGRGTQRAGIKMQRAATAPAAAGAVAAPVAAAATKKSKPIIGLGTKAKILGGVGLAGAGYLGYKGLQTTRDYMMIPSYSSQRWGYGNVRQQPSAYGY